MTSAIVSRSMAIDSARRTRTSFHGWPGSHDMPSRGLRTSGLPTATSVPGSSFANCGMFGRATEANWRFFERNCASVCAWSGMIWIWTPSTYGSAPPPSGQVGLRLYDSDTEGR